jgi:hypothetical protein
MLTPEQRAEIRECLSIGRELGPGVVPALLDSLDEQDAELAVVKIERDWNEALCINKDWHKTYVINLHKDELLKLVEAGKSSDDIWDDDNYEICGSTWTKYASEIVDSQAKDIIALNAELARLRQIVERLVSAGEKLADVADKSSDESRYVFIDTWNRARAALEAAQK